MIEKWKLDMIIDWWLKDLAEGCGVIQNSGTPTIKEKSICYEQSNKSQKVKRKILGYKLYLSSEDCKDADSDYEKIEIYSGIEFFNKDNSTYNFEQARKETKSRRNNIHITITPTSNVFHKSDSAFEAFTESDLEKLFNLIEDPDKTIQEHNEQFPIFEKHSFRTAINMQSYEITDGGDIIIKFLADDRLLTQKGLYLGFEVLSKTGKPTIYVFKVRKKKVFLGLQWSERSEYEARFYGYLRPPESYLVDATFKWIINEDIIKKADKESEYI